MGNRRTDIQIIGDILRVQKACKTDIALEANIGHPQLDTYLNFLIDRGFITRECDSRAALYYVTPLGNELLKSIDNVTRLLGLTVSCPE